MSCCVLLCTVVLCIVVLCTVVLRIVVSCLNSLILETINIMTSKIHNTTINYLDFNQRRDQFFSPYRGSIWLEILMSHSASVHSMSSLTCVGSIWLDHDWFSAKRLDRIVRSNERKSRNCFPAKRA